MANEEKNVVEKKFLKIERETYESKAKEERYSYFVRGNLRGKEMKSSLVPSDIGGYELLDLLFIDDSEVKLIVVPFELNNSETGELVKGNTYVARTTDKKGEVYECPIKPRQKSDKAILEMLLSRL